MFKYIVEQLPGSDYYGIISLVMFFTFFIGILIMVFRADKEYLKKMEHMPLEPTPSNGDKINGSK